MSEITRVSPESGDWEYIYLDGKLIAEGHRVPLHELATKLGFKFSSFEISDEYAESEMSKATLDEIQR